MTKAQALEIINSYPGYALNALKSVYRGRMYAVCSYKTIAHYSKTQKGAEGYINRHSNSWYDEYLQQMVSSSYEIIELTPEEITDPCTNKHIWYAWLKEVNGQTYMYNNVKATAEQMEGITPDVLQFVLDCLAEMGPTGGLRWIAEYEEPEQQPEIITEDIEEQIAEEQQLNDAEEPETTAKNTSASVAVNYNAALNGIELTFEEKPSEAIREQLKAHGFRWSKKQGLWYARNNTERRTFAESLTTVKPTEEAAPIDYPDIDINDLHTYRIDANLQTAEHAGHWLFRGKEIDRTTEIQALLGEKQKEVEQFLTLTTDERLRYRLKKTLQSYKRRYFANYVARMRNQANNPSWIVTGRSGRNARRDQKMNSRYDNLMRECIQIDKDYDSAIYTLSNLIKREKEIETRERAAAINTSNLHFTTGREQITLAGLTETVRTYRAGTYMICKTWGCFRIFHDGKEIHAMRTIDRLEDAKKYVCIRLTQDETQQAM